VQNCVKRNGVNVAVLLKTNSCTVRTQKIYHLMSNSTENCCWREWFARTSCWRGV